jgi:glycosyltransferase involved in cell wall biosynthesis
MRILFVYGNVYAVGGIQTLLARFSARLSEDGHEVELLTRPPGDPDDATTTLLDEISRNATVHYASANWLRAPRSLRHLSLPSADIIFPCSLQSLLLAVIVQQRTMPRARLVVGVFAPREYCWYAPGLARRWIQHLTERVFREIPIENVIYSTDGMARQTGECIGRDFSLSPVLPLAIDLERLQLRDEEQVDRRKIVSVQRLTPYYTHHEQVIRVIAALRDIGEEFEYHIYGDGPTRDALQTLARQLNVGDAVHLHGTVPYNRFEHAVNDAFACVGMGTSLLEAAACGVPSLVAIDSHPAPFTYGLIQDTSGNDLGGHVPGHPRYSFAERFLWLRSLSPREYGQVGAGSRARAEQFGLNHVLPRFLDMLARSRPFGPRISRLDRVVAMVDGARAAVSRRAGLRDAMADRHLRRPDHDELNLAFSTPNSP